MSFKPRSIAFSALALVCLSSSAAEVKDAWAPSTPSSHPFNVCGVSEADPDCGDGTNYRTRDDAYAAAVDKCNLIKRPWTDERKIAHAVRIVSRQTGRVDEWDCSTLKR